MVHRTPPSTPVPTRSTRSGPQPATDAAAAAAQAAQAALRSQADALATASTSKDTAAAVGMIDSSVPPLSVEHEGLRKRRKELTEMLMSDKKKFTKVDSMAILNIMNDMEIEYIRMTAELAFYKGQVKAMETAESQRPKTYAGATAVGNVPTKERRERTPSAKRLPTKNRYTVLVRPLAKDSSETSQQTKDKLLKELDVGKSGIKVKGVRKTKSAAVVVEVATEQDITRLKQDPKIKDLSLEITQTRKRRPRMIILNVDRTMKQEDIAENLYRQNDFGEGGTLEEFRGNLVPVFRTGPREKPYCHWVVEVAPAVRRQLRTRGRLYLGYGSCKVDDFVSVSRCYKCQAFGHTQAKCRREQPVCGHCAQRGHMEDACASKTENPKCANCEFAKIDSKHEVKSKDCPCYKHALRRETESTEV